jgi:hypothetical protein
VGSGGLFRGVSGCIRVGGRVGGRVAETDGREVEREGMG